MVDPVAFLDVVVVDQPIPMFPGVVYRSDKMCVFISVFRNIERKHRLAQV